MTTVKASGVGRSADEVLIASRGLIDTAMRAAVATLPPSPRRVARYHFGWRNEHDRPDRHGGGKAIRPALALLAAQGVGANAEVAIPAAVAVEVLHNFTLLHDDVMDGDHDRRHRAAAWTVFGVNQAILAGDALLGLAYQVLSASGPRASGTLHSAVMSLVDGQSADLDLQQRTGVTLAECVQMAECKTGALFGCSCALGGLLGGASDEQLAHLRQFGERLGLAFQHVDDLLGIWGDPAVTGKPVHSDLSRGKKTLPVAAALSSNTPAGKALAELYRNRTPLSSADLIRAAELVDEAGGRAWSRHQADEMLSAALSHLRLAGLRPCPAAELGELAHLATYRVL